LAHLEPGADPTRWRVHYQLRYRKNRGAWVTLAGDAPLKRQ
jgi:hypothetical protein